MIIFAENNLEHISNELQKRGYTVSNPNNSLNPDVYLYYENTTDIREKYSGFHNQLYPQISAVAVSDNAFGNFMPTSNGTLLINVYNKSIDEITNIIERRLYSPIF